MNNTDATSKSTDKSAYIALAMAPLIPCIIFGNALVLIAVYRYKHMRTNSNILIAAQALNDLIIGAVSAPLMLAIYVIMIPIAGNEGLPVFVNVMWIVPNIVSILAIYIVLFITIERYVAVVFPLKLKILMSRKKLMCYMSTTVVITTVWCMPFGLCIIWNYSLINDIPFNFVMVIICYIIPFWAIIILYSITLYKFRKYQAECLTQTSGNDSSVQNKRLSKAEQKLTASLSIIIILLIISYVPNVTWWVMSYYITSVAMNVFSLVSNVLQVTFSIFFLMYGFNVLGMISSNVYY